MAGCCHCCLSVVSCQSLSVVGRRLPFVGSSSFFIVRCPLTFVASFWLCLQGSPTAPARLGFGQSMYVHTSALNTHTHIHRTCVCPAHLLLLREILHMQPRNSVQLCNCATVQLVELFPAWIARATTSVAVETSSTPHLLQWHHLHFPQHLHPRHANLPQTQNECGISLFARLPGKYFALILAHRET